MFFFCLGEGNHDECVDHVDISVNHLVKWMARSFRTWNIVKIAKQVGVHFSSCFTLMALNPALQTPFCSLDLFYLFHFAFWNLKCDVLFHPRLFGHFTNFLCRRPILLSINLFRNQEIYIQLRKSWCKSMELFGASLMFKILWLYIPRRDEGLNLVHKEQTLWLLIVIATSEVKFQSKYSMNALLSSKWFWRLF